MKKNDFYALLLLSGLFLPFFMSAHFREGYERVNAGFPYLLSFLKFAILATFGECLGLRLRTGVYSKPGFGILPRALVWGILGMMIKSSFVIFGDGAPLFLKTLGVNFSTDHPAGILREPGFSWIKLLAAFGVSTMMNLYFAPLFMAFHRITDSHIHATGGSLRGFFRPLEVKKYIRENDWVTFWDFVLKKTIPLFWIPAHTLNFMLPEEYRVLVAALFSIVLGIFMSLASIMQNKKQLIQAG